jgi:hypothetical protein
MCKSGLALLSRQSLAGKLDVEAAAAKPQEDGWSCRHLSRKSSAFGHKATSSLLLEKALTMCSLLAGSLLAFVGGMLIEEALAVSGLLFFASSFLVKMALAGRRLEAVALVLPQFVDCPLPILVGAFRAGTSPMKDGPPGRFWRQQAGGLLVFAKCLLDSFLVAKGTTNIGRGIQFSIILKHPVGGAWGRLRPLVLQPPGRIGEGGCGQMSRRWSTVPHLWRRMRGGVLTHLYQIGRTKVRQN